MTSTHAHSQSEQAASVRKNTNVPGHNATSSAATITSQNLGKPVTDQLYNPHQKQVASSCFDLLIIEIVPLAMRIVDEIREQQQSQAANGTSPQKTAEDDDVYYRVEQYGYRLGRGLAEVFTRERGRFANQLDVMKFICKELWPLVFKKQIDNLKTNHRVRTLILKRKTVNG